MNGCGVVSSARTGRRRLDKVGLFGRVARKKQLLKEQHKKKLLARTQERKTWTTEEWFSVIWSGESKFNLFGNDGRVYVRRRMGEELIPECIQQTVNLEEEV